MSTKVQILVVEDNPAVLKILTQGLASCGDVHTATDGADAILKAVDTKPDIIVLDYQMPGLNGRQLYDKLRERDGFRKVPFVFLGSRAELEEKLRPFTEGAEDYIPKPFFVRDLASRVKKVTDRILLEKLQTTARKPGVIEGQLAEMNIIDLFQSLEMGQKTCRLTLEEGGKKSEIYFEGGGVYDAVMDDVTGDQAVYPTAGWNAGTFEIDFNAKPSAERRTTQGTQGLLMEAMRLLDEAEQGGGDD